MAAVHELNAPALKLLGRVVAQGSTKVRYVRGTVDWAAVMDLWAARLIDITNGYWDNDRLLRLSRGAEDEARATLAADGLLEDQS